jgi:hypothetical protein
LATVFLSQHVRADPARDIITVQIDDQATQLVLTWRFHYFQLPNHFLLKEKQSEVITVFDDTKREQKLRDFVSVAFDIRINDQPVTPRIEKFQVWADRSVESTLVFPGTPNGHVEIRAPALQYFSGKAYINLRVSNPDEVVGGFLSATREMPGVYNYVQVASNGQRSLLWRMDNWLNKLTATNAFKTEFRTAWVNCNWLFICIVLLLMQMGKRVLVLVGSMIVCWIFLCLLWVVSDYRFPFQISEIVLSIPTVLLCWVTVRHPGKVVWLTLITLIAGLLNGCYDMQQIPLKNPDQAAFALLGLCFGFVAGMALVFLIIFPLLWECKKYPGFQKDWAPKICWVIAVLAIFVPVQQYLFK